MKFIQIILPSVLALTLIACGKSEGNKKDGDAPTSLVPIDPVETAQPDIFSTDFKKQTENSLIECQQSYRFSTGCRLKDGAESIVLAPALSPARGQRYTVTIVCFSGESKFDYGFRLRADRNQSPVTVECRGQEPQIYSLQGQGDLELFVENPALLKTMLTSLNFVVEVSNMSAISE